MDYDREYLEVGFDAEEAVGILDQRDDCADFDYEQSKSKLKSLIEAEAIRSDYQIKYKPMLADDITVSHVVLCVTDYDYRSNDLYADEIDVDSEDADDLARRLNAIYANQDMWALPNAGL